MSDSTNNIHPIIKKMLLEDRMTDWLKAEVLESRPGFCRLSMIVREGNGKWVWYNSRINNICTCR